MTTDGIDVYYGGAVKAMGGGRIQVLLVPFTSPEDIDADGEFFHAETDFDREFPAKMSLWFHHGMDEELGDRKLGRVEVKTGDAGLWFEHQLNMADAYEAKMYELAERGKLGGSSGALNHLVRKTHVGKAVSIDRWPLGEASLTCTPCHFSARAQALKSWEPTPLDEALKESPQADACPDCGSSRSLAETTEAVTKAVTTLTADYKALALKEGRTLSAARRARLESVLTELQALLTETTPRPRDAAAPATVTEATDIPTPEELEAASVIPLPDLRDLFAARVAEGNGLGWLGG